MPVAAQALLGDRRVDDGLVRVKLQPDAIRIRVRQSFASAGKKIARFALSLPCPFSPG
jgi:hypothetical protein